MSALGQFLPDHRAPREVKPYRADVRPSRTRMATVTRSATRRQPSKHNYEDRLVFARDVGYFRGLSDKHFEDRNFETGAEWLSWLSGWRLGQIEFQAMQTREAKEIEREEKALLEVLHHA